MIWWLSASNRYYELRRSTNLVDGFYLLQTNIPATPPANVYTDSVDGIERSFYRIRLER